MVAEIGKKISNRMTRLLFIGSLFLAISQATAWVSVYDFSEDSVEKLNIKEEAAALLKELSDEQPIVGKIIELSEDAVGQLVVAQEGWSKACHYHTSSARLRLLTGRYWFQTPGKVGRTELVAGDEAVTPAGLAHAEGAFGDYPAVFLVKWSPPPGANSTIPLDDSKCLPGLF